MTIELNAASGGLLTALVEGPGDAAGDETRFEAGVRNVEIANFNSLAGTAGVELGNVLADTGSISPGGDFEFHILAHANIAVTLHIERRDVADGAALQTLQLVLIANEPASVVFTVKDILGNQSVRITLQTEIVSPNVVNTAIRMLRR